MSYIYPEPPIEEWFNDWTEEYDYEPTQDMCDRFEVHKECPYSCCLFYPCWEEVEE